MIYEAMAKNSSITVPDACNTLDPPQSLVISSFASAASMYYNILQENCICMHVYVTILLNIYSYNYVNESQKMVTNHI